MNSLVRACWGALAACAVLLPMARAQQTAWDRFNGNNATMSALEPMWMSPLIQSDPRLTQAVRLSVSHSSVPGAQVLNYGNNHGISLIVGTRFQVDATPPSFFRNHCSQLPDGWGNAGTQVKFRLASGNASHGNFAVTAILGYGFAPRAYQNGAFSSYFMPKLAAGKAFGRFNVQSVLSGVLPTARTDQQGQMIEWNTTAQMRTTSHTWFDIEDNPTFNFNGPFNRKTQNFLTPAAYFMVNRRSWGPNHPTMILDAGMQIATSSFYLYNRNLITEMRIAF